MKKNRIVINGNPVEVEGNNVSVVGDSVYVDGKLVSTGLTGITEIHWYGDLANLEAGGSVACRDIYGSAKAGNSIHCRSIQSGSRGSCNITAGNSIHF